MKEQVFRVQVNHERRGSSFMVYNKTRSVMLQGNGKGTEALQRFLRRQQVRIVHESEAVQCRLKPIEYDLTFNGDLIGCTSTWFKGYALPRCGQAWWRTGKR